MKVRELFKRLNNGESRMDICKELGIDRTSLPNILRRLGYECVGKDWLWQSQEEEPLDENVLDYVGRKSGSSTPNPKRVNPSPKAIREVQTSRSEVASTIEKESIEIPLNIFTNQDMKDLKQMIEEWRNKPFKIMDNPNSTTSLYDRIKELEQDHKIRKTFALSESIAEELDQFTEREKVNKSDILHLALKDFIKQYK